MILSMIAVPGVGTGSNVAMEDGEAMREQPAGTVVASSVTGPRRSCDWVNEQLDNEKGGTLTIDGFVLACDLADPTYELQSLKVVNGGVLGGITTKGDVVIDNASVSGKVQAGGDVTVIDGVIKKGLVVKGELTVTNSTIQQNVDVGDEFRCEDSVVRGEDCEEYGSSNRVSGSDPVSLGEQSAINYRIDAYDSLKAESLPGNGRQDRLEEILNGTFEKHVDSERITDVTLFEDDRKITAQTQHQAPTVADNLSASGERLATVAISDVKRVRDEFDDSGVSYDQEQVANLLSRAQINADLGRNLHQRGNFVGAIALHERAWKRAQQALDRLAEATAPEIQLADREDPIHDGAYTYPLQGTLFTVRPYAVENVSLSVNGESRELQAAAETVPGEPLGFGANVELDGTVNELTISATVDPVAWDNSSQTGGDPERVESTLRLDADGLIDRTEDNVTGTDPLDPDSDSARTDIDESGDGVRDGEEDFDGDGLPTITELKIGTDPFDADSDDDDLDDGTELSLTRTDPLDPDSNAERTSVDESGDGVRDGEEDFDGDGLTATKEVDVGTDPVLSDTDGDGLSDLEELDLGTDPLAADSDDDGLRDGQEREAAFETDPLDPDTDDDGVLDGNESYTTTTGTEGGDVTVAVTGQGDAAADVSIRTVEGRDETPSFAATSTVRVRNESAFDEAEITFSIADIDRDLDNATADTLTVYTWEPGEDVTWRPVETTIDRENETVSATVESFSFFSVFYAEEWDDANTDVVTVNDTDDADDVQRVDAMLVIDESGSMDGERIKFAKIASKRFVGALFDDEQVGLASYASSGSLREGLTTDHDAVNASIDALSAGGSTNTGEGLQVALDELDANGDETRPDEVILLSDGKTNTGPDPVSIAENAPEQVTISTIGLGGGIDEDELRAIADATGGDFQQVEDESDLPETFERVAENRTGFVDTDEDGIPDVVENASLTLYIPGPGGPPTSQAVDLDYNDMDTDGDGLNDSREVADYEITQVETEDGMRLRVSANFVSNPSREDTDGDGLDDETEYNGWTINVEKRDGDPYRYDSGGATISVDSDPKVWDTDDDLLSDGEEFEARTDPRERVTYGITEDHQDDIVDGVYEAWDGGDAQERANIRSTAREIGIISENQDISTLRRDRLTDARDSFDFVYPGDGSDVIDDLTFKSLDYVPEYNEVERSDIWLSTLEELGVHDTDPWDPDTDDDGLTDGQELYGITKLSLTTPSRVGDLRRVTDDGDFDFEGLDPSDPDSDGDSYWDGWIGVWNVEDSKNLILYMENLQNGGVSGDEAVPEQAGVHEVVRGDPPSQTSADIDGDRVPEHSNVHIGAMSMISRPSPPDAPNTPTFTSANFTGDRSDRERRRTRHVPRN